MNDIKDIYKNYKKYLHLFTFAFILLVIIHSLIKFPILSPVEVGDEGYYRLEVEHLAKFGLYNSLSQGTSVVYSCFIYLFAKVFSIKFLVSARILTILFFLVCCRLFLKCFELFKDISYSEKYMGLAFFVFIASKWLMKGLPDLVSISFLLTAFYLLSTSNKYKYLIFSGILIFIGFAIKPTVLFALLALTIFVFLKNRKKQTWIQNAIRSSLFIFSFIFCFVIYHIPGFQTYHKLMLEDKSHYYVNGIRLKDSQNWNELNIYYELYNVNNKPNKWSVTWTEVDSFKQQHPDINLNLTYPEYVKNHSFLWAKKLSYSIFISLPCQIQRGFFFAKWTSINNIVKNTNVIYAISFLIITGIYFFELKFIKQNVLLFSVFFLYFSFLSIYVIPQLEDNWLLYCLPFLALPVVKFLVRYVNIMILLTLQFLYVFI